MLPAGKYRIGLKAAYELYSTSVRDRVKKDYQEKKWSAFLNPALADASKNLQKFEAAHSGKYPVVIWEFIRHQRTTDHFSYWKLKEMSWVQDTTG